VVLATDETLAPEIFLARSETGDEAILERWPVVTTLLAAEGRLDRERVGVDPALAVRKVERVSVVVVVEVDTLDVGREDTVPLFVLGLTEVETAERRETGRETARARGPLPVTLTLSLDERVLPLELGLEGLFVGPGVTLLRSVDWDLTAEDFKRLSLGDFPAADLTLARDARVMSTLLTGVWFCASRLRMSIGSSRFSLGLRDTWSSPSDRSSSLCLSNSGSSFSPKSFP
jgi:hypothetical protein